MKANIITQLLFVYCPSKREREKNNYFFLLKVVLLNAALKRPI